MTGGDFGDYSCHPGRLMWRDAPGVYGPPKTLYNRFIRWSRIGVFDRIFATLAGGARRLTPS